MKPRGCQVVGSQGETDSQGLVVGVAAVVVRGVVAVHVAGDVATAPAVAQVRAFGAVQVGAAGQDDELIADLAADLLHHGDELHIID